MDRVLDIFRFDWDVDRISEIFFYTTQIVSRHFSPPQTIMSMGGFISLRYGSGSTESPKGNASENPPLVMATLVNKY